MNLIDEKRLLQMLSEGNETAFRKLFDLYKERLLHFADQFIHSRADAEEIVQDTFIALWKHRALLGKVKHPGNYIYTITRNKTRDYLARVARDEKLLKQVWYNMQEAVEDTEELLKAKESGLLIHHALGLLPELKQRVFYLSRREGLSHQEIALETGLSKSRVKNIIVETLNYLRSYLRNHLPALLAACAATAVASWMK